MSERLQNLKKARNNAASTFTQIIQLNSKYTSPLFCCFEGEDFKYYGVRVEQAKTRHHDKLIPLKCGGKDVVIRLQELIGKEETLVSRDILYFVDLDFDESIGNKKEFIYETPFYSIENFYTTKCAFEKILNAELKIEETENSYEFCINKFTERQKEFHEGTLYLNAWVYCQRRANVDRLYLNEFKLSTIVKKISIDHIDFNNYDKIHLKQCLPNAIEISDSEIEDAKLVLKNNPQQRYRGKFEIEFLYEFLTDLIKKINSKQIPFVKSKKVGLNLSKVNIISELSQYALTPSCLKEYVQKNA